MTRFQYYMLWLFLFVVSLGMIELVWIGAKFIFERGVVHTYLDHAIAVCGACYVARDGMTIRMKLLNDGKRRRSEK